MVQLLRLNIAQYIRKTPESTYYTKDTLAMSFHDGSRCNDEGELPTMKRAIMHRGEERIFDWWFVIIVFLMQGAVLPRKNICNESRQKKKRRIRQEKDRLPHQR